MCTFSGWNSIYFGHGLGDEITEETDLMVYSLGLPRYLSGLILD